MSRIKKDDLPKEVLYALEGLTLYEIVEKDRRSGRESENLVLTTQEFIDMKNDLKREIDNLKIDSDRKYERYSFALKEKLKRKNLIIID